MAEDIIASPNPKGPQKASLLSVLAPLAGIVIILLMLTWMFNMSMVRTEGAFSYPLDDSYIHLALAKNLAAHGVWGATPYEAAAASSSPLWTALLGLCFKIFGNNVLFPLILNIIFAIAAFLVAQKLSQRWIKNAWVRAGIAFVMMLGLPVTVIVFIGMEHMLHILLTLLFIGEMLDSLEDDRRKVHFWRLFALGLLMALTRYESLFLFVVPLIMALRKRRIELIAPMLGGIAGVTLFGLSAMSKGLPFLPNTLLVKSDYAAYSLQAAMVRRFVLNFFFLLPMNVALVVSTIAAMFWAKKLRPALLTLVGGLLLHYAFADVRWGFLRYEAYLVGAFVFVLFVILATSKGVLPKVVIGLPLVGLCLTLANRLYFGTIAIILGMGNIHDQQFQMARFINECTPNARVAVIDVGAVGYYTDAHIIDLCGLASNDVRELRVKRALNQAAIGDILAKHNADYAIIHAYFFRPIGGLPAYMEPLAGWQIPNNVTCGADTVTFYVPERNREQLIRSLEAFDPTLPKDVRVVPPQR
jgi:hypothetical protein